MMYVLCFITGLLLPSFIRVGIRTQQEYQSHKVSFNKRSDNFWFAFKWAVKDEWVRMFS